jgi:hypothetical protein
LELFAPTFKVMGVKLALAGCDMVTTDAVFCVEILNKIGRSPCACWRSGAANQKVVSVWALATLKNKARVIKM